jgi:hypothetical protein
VWVRLRRPYRVALTALAVAVPLAGCGGGGGGDDRATVEANLRDYLATGTHSAPFPIGAGPPRVKENGCKDLHRKFNPRELLRPGWTKFKKGEKFAAWVCVVRFKKLALPVAVAVKDSTEVVWAWPGTSNSPGISPSPPRTYTG